MKKLPSFIEHSINNESVAFDKLCMLIYNLDETSQKS